MILIIEGMDRCGKSTLVSNLRKHYFKNPKLIVHHSSAPPKGVADSNAWEVDHYTSLFETAHDLVKFEGYDVIFDRFHLGAVVYGTKYRDADPTSIYKIDNKFFNRRINAAIILLTDYSEAISSRDDGNSLENSIEEYEQTRKSFIEAYDSSRCGNKLHINITNNGGFENTLPSVISFLENI